MENAPTERRYQDLIVVKVGTSTLTKDLYENREPDWHSFHNIGQQVLRLATSDSRVALVSSGAIAEGMRLKRLKERPEDTTTLQKLACIGQRPLLNHWSRALEGRLTGQLLFTRHELEDQNEGLHLSEVTQSLLRDGDIPIANENDALSHEEITFGDNDTLAARFASLIHRSGMFERTRLVLLTDVDGVYKDPGDPTSVVRSIKNLSTAMNYADDIAHELGTGGMHSKLSAAMIASDSNIDTFIANGRTPNAIKQTLDGEIGTHIRFQNDY